MTRGVEQRRKAARWSLAAWYSQVGIGAILSALAIAVPDPWAAVLLVYVTLLSVWTGIESAHARLNADLPSEPTEKETS